MDVVDDAEDIEKALQRIFSNTNGPPMKLEPKRQELGQHRKDHGLSQSELARQIGTAASTIRRLENGETKKTNPDVLYAISYVLGVTLADIASGVPEPTVREEATVYASGWDQYRQNLNRTLKEYEANHAYSFTRLKNRLGDLVTPSSLNEFPNDAIVIVLGYVGQGKSALLRQFAISSTNDHQRLPVYCELVSQRDRSLVDIIHSTITSVCPLGTNVVDDEFLRQASVDLILDGFDELSTLNRVALLAELQDLKRHATNIRIVIGSRYGTELEHCPATTFYEIVDLTKDDFSNTAAALAPDRSADELNRLLVGDRIGIRELLTTPLLVSGLLRRFQPDRYLKENTLAFYRDLFDLVIRRQNESQYGPRRPLTCNVGYDGLQQFFEALCYLLFNQFGRSAFHIADLRRKATVAMGIAGYDTQASSAIDDILRLSNLVMEDDGDCRFLHPSVCEYHAAAFLDGRSHEEIAEFYCRARTDWLRWLHVLSFLADLDHDRMSVFLLLPDLEEIVTGGELSYLRYFTSFSVVCRSDTDVQFCISGATAYAIRSHQIVLGGIAPQKFSDEMSLWCPRIAEPEFTVGTSVSIPVKAIDFAQLAKWLVPQLSSSLSHCREQLAKCRAIRERRPDLQQSLN